MKYKFEKNIIDVILNLIKDNQEYLTKKENLPQLAKLGYMYNTLWYAGRVCWGYGGIFHDKNFSEEIKKFDNSDDSNWDSEADDNPYNWLSCEDNPKYKIEMCNPINSEIEDLIYDAWGMHVRDESDEINYDNFCKLIKFGKELSEFELKLKKPNKTMDEWVEILTDQNYRYQYSRRKSVVDHLLCSIGTGYGWNKDGFIIQEAGGADMDIDDYGIWENAIFRDDIAIAVNALLEIPELKLTLDEYYSYREKKEIEKKEKDFLSNIRIYEKLELAGLYKKEEGHLEYNEFNKRCDILFEGITGKKDSKKESKYNAYYPISSYSNIDLIINEEERDRLGIKTIHQSYIDEAIKICNDIIDNQEEEIKLRKNDGNVLYAKKFLNKLGIEKFDIEEIDKYKLESEIKQLLLPLNHFLNEGKGKNTYSFRFNNTKNNKYANNCYYLNISVDSDLVKMCYSNDIDSIIDLPFYEVLKNSLKEISKLNGIKTIKFYIDNYKSKHAEILIEFLIYDANYDISFENELSSNGFEIGSNMMILKLNDNYYVHSQKPKNLGNHPMNTTGKECFSNALEFKILENDSKMEYRFSLDERNFNILRPISNRHCDIVKWVVEKFKDMKNSNPNYGTYKDSGSGKEGTQCLYRHDLSLFLKEHINEYTEV